MTNARTQSNLKGETLYHKVKLQDTTTWEKRGTYKPRLRRVEDIRLTSKIRECVEVKGEVCVKLESGSLLPKAWKDLYY